MIEIKITGENVEVTGVRKLLSESVGQYVCRVTFDDSWALYERHLIFRVAERTRDIMITELSEILYIPAWLLMHPGNYMSISAVGICGDNRKFTNVFRSIPIVAGSSMEDLDKPYKSMINVSDRLWETEYEDLNYVAAEKYFKSGEMPPMPFCSAVRRGSLMLGTFDWNYNEEPTIVVHVSPSSMRYAYVGVAGGVAGLTEEIIFKKKYSLMYSVLPFLVNNGINDHGVFVKTNVVPDEGGSTCSRPLLDNRGEVSALQLCSYILMNFATAREAAEYVRDHLMVYFPRSLGAQHYQQHFMIGDAMNTFVIEFIENHTVINEIPYMTNFLIHDVIFNQDGTVLTPETSTDEDNAETVNNITPHGSGLERFNLIVNAYDELLDKDAMIALYKDLKYTRAYSGTEHEADPHWYTEFVGGELTCGKTEDAFVYTYDIAGKIHRNRRRDIGETWHTAHAVIYDISTLSVTVFNEEGDTAHEFTLRRNEE